MVKSSSRDAMLPLYIILALVLCFSLAQATPVPAAVSAGRATPSAMGWKCVPHQGDAGMTMWTPTAVLTLGSSSVGGCYSADKKACRWFPSLADCNSAAAAAPAPAIDNVLGCGSGAYKAQYGNSGFGDGSSWCDHIVNVTPFVCVQMPGQEAFTPAVFITIDNESAAGCYSEDKRNCKWFPSISACNASNPPAPSISNVLFCGSEAYIEAYGDPGTAAGGWCAHTAATVPPQQGLNFDATLDTGIALCNNVEPQSPLLVHSQSDIYYKPLGSPVVIQPGACYGFKDGSGLSLDLVLLVYQSTQGGPSNQWILRGAVMGNNPTLGYPQAGIASSLEFSDDSGTCILPESNMSKYSVNESKDVQIGNYKAKITRKPDTTTKVFDVQLLALGEFSWESRCTGYGQQYVTWG